MPLGTRAQRLLPLGDGDAYSPLGIRGGSFLFFPAVELATAYASNPSAVPHGAGSPYFVVAPELLVQSDWSRHSLTASIVGSYTDYTNGSFVPSLNRPYLNSKIDGRIDVTHDTQIVLENRFLVSTDNPGSPNLPAGLASLPIDTTLGGTLGVVQNFNRLIVSLKGTFDRVQYQNSTLTDGETASNADRDLNQYAGIARVGFDLDAGVKPFVEVQQDARVYDQQFDSGGQQRSSLGTSVKAGATVDLFGTLSGAMAIGYLDRTYQDPTLPKLSGLIADGALIWQATALTSREIDGLVAGERIDRARRFRRAQPRCRHRGRSRLPPLAHRHAASRLRAGQLCRRRAPRQPLLRVGGDDLQAQPRHLAQNRSAAELAAVELQRRLLPVDVGARRRALAALSRLVAKRLADFTAA